MYDRSAIAKEAHRLARLYAPKVNGKCEGYRAALSLGFRKAWELHRAIAARVAADTALTEVERSRRDERIAIHCSTDGLLTVADHNRLTELARAA